MYAFCNQKGMRQTYVKLCYYNTSKWAEDQVKILNILLYVVLDQFWMLGY